MSILVVDWFMRQVNRHFFSATLLVGDISMLCQTGCGLLIAISLLVALPSTSWTQDKGQPKAEPAEKERVVRLIWFPRFSPDGKWLLTAHGSWDGKEGGEAKVFDAATGEVKHTIKHPRGVRTVAWAPKGELFATGAYGGGVRLFDVRTAKPEREMNAGVSIENLRFSSDGTQLITSHGNGDLRVYNAQTLKEVFTIKAAHKGGIWGMAVSRNGKFAATAGKDGYVRIVDLEGKRILHPLQHPGETNGVAFTPDNKLLATGCGDSRIRLFEVRTGDEIGEAEGHERGSVPDLQFTSDGKQLVSAGMDGTVRIWDVSNPKQPALKRTIQAHDNLAFGVAISPDDRTIASVGWDEQVKAWDFASGDPKWSWSR